MGLSKKTGCANRKREYDDPLKSGLLHFQLCRFTSMFGIDQHKKAMCLRVCVYNCVYIYIYIHLEIHTTKIFWSFVSVLFCLVGSSKTRRLTKNTYELDEN